MANGDKQGTSGEILQVYMLDTVDQTSSTGTSVGAWVDFGPYLAWASLEIRGIAGATVLTLYGDNYSTNVAPAIGSTNTSVGTFNANGVYAFTPCRWMRMAVTTTGNSGNVSASVIARR